MSETKEPSFEELLNEAEARRVVKVEPGQKLTAKVVSISKDTAFVDIGMRSEASLPLDPEDERFAALAENQELEVFVVRVSGQVEVGLDPVMGFGDLSVAQQAFEQGTPVEGKISAVIGGGYEVNVAGVRCFCPFSQLNLQRVRDRQPEQFIGETFPFKVIELEEARSNVVLSRRALLEEELQRQIDETRAKLNIGAVMHGTVVDIRPFGAFVDLGGVQGLLHVSQLAHHNVPSVEDALSVGDELDVKVLDITQDQKGKERISLSRKALLPDPWDKLTIAAGDRLTGAVARKSKFGVFVAIAEGVDGLLPRRLMKQEGREVDMAQFEEGQELEVEVVEVNRDERKATLALPGWNVALESELKVGQTLMVEVIKVLPAGVLVQGVDDPAKGLIHKRGLKETSMARITEAFPPGSKHEAVLEERDDRGRLNFALKGEDHVDPETMGKFTDKDDSFGHNPFASFFNKK